MLQIILNLIAFFSNTYFGLMVYLKNRSSWTSKLFLLLALFVNVYIIVNYISLHPPDPSSETLLFWIRVVMAITSVISPTLFILAHTFPKKRITMNPVLLGAVLLLGLASFSASLGPWVFTGVEFPNGQPVPIPGPAMPLFFADFVGLIVASIVTLMIKYRVSKGLERVQILYFMLGTIGTFSLMAITTVVCTVILKITSLVFLGPVVILILLASMTYSIVRHRFLDISSLASRTVAYSLLVVFVALVYGSALFAAGLFFTQTRISYEQLFVSVTLALVLALTFQPLRRIVERVTQEVLFHSSYSSDDLLQNLSKIMTSTIDLNQLSQKISTALHSEMKVSAMHLVVMNEQNKVHAVLTSASTFKYKTQDELLQMVNKARNTEEGILVLEELESSDIKDAMRELDISVVMPLVHSNRLKGALLLGEKASGEVYSTQDISLLHIMTRQLAIVIDNAISYEKIKKFNVTLRREIENATSKLKAANVRLKSMDKAESVAEDK